MNKDMTDSTPKVAEQIPTTTTVADINFEDLIKVSNVNIKSTKDEVVSSSTTASEKPVVTSTTNQKVLQKISGPITAKNVGSSGQVVIIQGQSVPIRIASAGTVNPNNAISSTNQNKQFTIQVLKMPDGSLVHLKNNKTINLANIPSANTVKKTTNGQNQSLIIKTTATDSSSTGGTIQSKTTTTVSNIIGAKLIKSISSADVQKAVAASKAKVIENLKIQKSTSNNPTSSTETSTTDTNTIVISDSPEKVVCKQESVLKETDASTAAVSGSKQVIVPHHVLKLSPNTASQIQTIQIPGKQGVQYVRVLGTTASGTTVTSSNSTTTPKILNTSLTLSSKDNTPTITKISGGNAQQIILNTKARQSSILASTAMKQKCLLTTIPTLKKIKENERHLTLIKKEVDNDDQQQKHSNGQHTKSPNKILMVSKDFLKRVKNINNDSTSNSDNSTADLATSIKNSVLINENSTTSPKKLFSVLKNNYKESSSSNNNNNNNNENITVFSSSGSRRNSTPSPTAEDEPRRKHCNCTKSQCLKLYCDCFANGEFCQDCNCKECFNNLENEGERQKAIQMCLDRNPNAFKPKITKARDQSDQRLHNKGCNCKRSGCLKNYCECYEAKISCSSNCKCQGCRNIEGRPDREIQTEKPTPIFTKSIIRKRSYDDIITSASDIYPILNEIPTKQPYNYITEDVVSAAVQCMFAQIDECRKSDFNHKICERMVTEELGKCFVEIVDFSIRNMDN